MTKSRKALKTDSDVIAAYGGTSGAAKRFDVSPGAVSQWRTLGIPPGYHYQIAMELESQGYIVDGRALGWR